MCYIRTYIRREGGSGREQGNRITFGKRENQSKRSFTRHASSESQSDSV